ncbi:MAG: hypothetical protein IRZ10_06345 [Thermoflavifilum sp.]|nr:hypothetical protein [Thermoflavifilum sp.]MCL6514025.1 hypothetical protein [Alicyclobacillus sp.]
MTAHEAFAIVLAFACLWLTGRSIVSHVKAARQSAPLEGRRTQVREWLMRSGYDVLPAVEPVVWRGYVDGEMVERTSRVDFIARRAGHEYAVVAADEATVAQPAEQLCAEWFPVRTALDVAGVLFVCPEGETVRVVEFEVQHPTRVRRRRWGRRAGLVLAGVLMALAWFHAV